MMVRNSFSKEEHLYGEKKITRLFTEGEAFITYPLRVVYLLLPEEDNVPVKVMVGAPKKRFKRAVKRNRLKRLMRESFRLNKHDLIHALTDKNLQMHVSFQYVSDEELPFSYIEKKMQAALDKLKSKTEAL